MPLSDAQITKKVGELRKSEGKIYAPLKYFTRLPTMGPQDTTILGRVVSALENVSIRALVRP